MKLSWDIFCTVVDNYGDIGVCWRLARQLASEHGFVIRLWVDDLTPFARLCPDLDVTQELQTLRGVAIRRWCKPFPDVTPADVVVEAFGCPLPANYRTAMALQSPQPAWINLEYLSAEPWVNGTHGLPSPQPPLTRYFFFPGFTSDTGGLLRERSLLAQRDEFQDDKAALRQFWASIGMPIPHSDEIRVSLFCYDSAYAEALLRAWSVGPKPITCIVPQGIVTRALAALLGPEPMSGAAYVHGSLTLHVIPFLEQDRYDRLLWACDMNFVRGEDSFVRAQWAGRPFVWHIYPQQQDVHRIKLNAFLDLYCADLLPPHAQQLRSFWHAWNGQGDVAAEWRGFVEQQIALTNHAIHWLQRLSEQTDLAANLAALCNNLLKSRVST
ncbi:MAG: elongation factor P maturation arginine rhamnosyltransferase EarP [Burkholderiales bacterium]